MNPFQMKPDVSLGDLLTATSIAISAAALIGTWLRDQHLKRKEYADRIRHAAGLVVSKIERWQEVSLSLFDEVQALITEADMKLVDTHDQVAVRDFLWRGLILCHSELARKCHDEQIELSYVDLYGYDPRIYALFSECITRMKAIDEAMFLRTLMATQVDVLAFKKKRFASAELGNVLRSTCSALAASSNTRLADVVQQFREEMLNLICSSDKDIYRKTIRIKPPEAVWSKDTFAGEEDDKMADWEQHATPLCLTHMSPSACRDAAIWHRANTSVTQCQSYRHSWCVARKQEEDHLQD